MIHLLVQLPVQYSKTTCGHSSAASRNPVLSSSLTVMHQTKHKHLITHKATAVHWHGRSSNSKSLLYRHMACGGFLCEELTSEGKMGTITPLPLTSQAKSHFSKGGKIKRERNAKQEGMK